MHETKKSEDPTKFEFVKQCNKLLEEKQNLSVEQQAQLLSMIDGKT